MTENPKKQPEWVVKHARKFNREKPDEPLYGELSFPPVQADPGSARLPDNSAGLPVDANQAVYMIKNFLKYYDRYKKITEDLTDKSKSADKALTFSAADQKSFAAVQDALDVTYGVSFNKDIILKILSQPDCEGIRLYLCATKDKEDPHVSLVVVGVDKNNYDLNYQPKDGGKQENDDETPTKSLIGEYGYPPDDGGTGGGTKDPHKKAIDDKYFLLKQASLMLAKEQGGEG
jgi:hypothetical protein